MYPVQRSRDASVYLALNLADRILRDDNAAQGTSTPKRARVATVSVQRDSSAPLPGFNVAIHLSGGLTFGRLDIDEVAQKALDQAGAATAGRYSKLSLSVSGAVAFNQRWSAVTTLRAQQALGRNLDGSEQLSISGPAGIKSYPDGVTSDNGFLWNAELQRTLPEVAGIRQSAGTFVDYGAVRPEHGQFTTVGRVAISDVGLAYEASGKKFFARLQWTHTTGSQVETGSDNHRTKVLAQLGLHF
jgi:hemolysin activation/secretion protein